MKIIKTNKKRLIINSAIIITSGILIITGLNLNTIKRIYHGVTLFDQSKLSENFRNLDQTFDSLKVAPSDSIFLFHKDVKDLPIEYMYHNEKRSIQEFIEKTGTTGLLVARGNTILYEHYSSGYSESDRMITWSVSKSVISALVGIAIEAGYISSVYDLVTLYVPSLELSGYDGVRIIDVLQMSSGIGFNENYADRHSDVNQLGSRAIGFGGSLEDVILSLKREREPSTYHNYVSSDTQVLGMVLRAATGVSLAQFTQDKLWKPAGMEFDAYWLIDSDGVEAAFGGFNASLRDLARFGLLYLNHGFMMGQHIIPQLWIKESLWVDAAHLLPGNNPNSSSVLGYGYQWWIPGIETNDFLAMGIYGQAIYINFDHNIVIVKTSAYKDYRKDGEKMELESIEFFRHITLHMGSCMSDHYNR